NVSFFEGDAGSLCQILQGFIKSHALILLQKLKHIAHFTTAKTLKALHGFAHKKGGGFFGMKGTQTFEVGASALKIHTTADDLDNIGGSFDLLNLRHTGTCTAGYAAVA